MISWLHTHKKDIIITLLIFVAALGLRLYALNSEGINADEYRWHDRTNRFHDAITDNRWEDTMTAGHPGATVTWQSMISMRTMRLLYRVVDPTYDYQNYPHLTETFDRVHTAMALPMVLTSAAFIAFLYAALRALTNREFAFIAAMLVLFDMYFLAHSRVVQMDALQASYIGSSLLTALLYRKYRHVGWTVATGVLLGFNVMTKIYGLAALPFVMLIMYWDDLTAFFRGKGERSTIVHAVTMNGLILLGVLIMTSIALLPAWVLNFDYVIATFKRSIFQEGIEGLWEGNEFFFGKLYLGGEPRIFYLVAFLFRQSIVPFVMLPVTLVLLLRNKITDRNIKTIMIVAALYTLYWTLMLTIPSKKEDRYILLDHVLVDLIAAAGIYTLYHMYKAKEILATVSKRAVHTGAGLLMVILFLVSINGLNGEYLGYYNPLLGGSHTAVKLMRVGWGEGLRPVAAYLNTLDDPENTYVSSWYESSMSPFCECIVFPTFEFEDRDVTHLVYYVNQLQRGKEEIMIEKYFNEDEIVFTHEIKGLPYSWVVEKK